MVFSVGTPCLLERKGREVGISQRLLFFTMAHITNLPVRIVIVFKKEYEHFKLSLSLYCRRRLYGRSIYQPGNPLFPTWCNNDGAIQLHSTVILFITSKSPEIVLLVQGSRINMFKAPYLLLSRRAEEIQTEAGQESKRATFYCS